MGHVPPMGPHEQACKATTDTLPAALYRRKCGKLLQYLEQTLQERLAIAQPPFSLAKVTSGHFTT